METTRAEICRRFRLFTTTSLSHTHTNPGVRGRTEKECPHASRGLAGRCANRKNIGRQAGSESQTTVIQSKGKLLMKLTHFLAEPRGLTSKMLWLAVAKGTTLLLSFMLPFVLVRKLDQTEFGLYKQVFQILVTVVSLLGLQVAASVYYFMPREPKKHPQIAQNVFIFYGLLGLAVASLFALFPHWTRHIFQHDSLALSVPMLGLAILLWLAASGIEGVMIVNRDVRLAAGFTLISQLSKVLLLIVAALVWGTIHALIVAAAVQGVLVCALLFVYMRHRYGHFWFAFDWPLFKAQVANALPFGVGGLAFVVQNDLHNYFVSYHFPPAEFAIYATGCFQLPLVSVLFDAVEMVLTPEMGRLESQQNYGQIIAVWLNTIRQLALIFMPICALLLVVRYEFIVLLFTKNYVASAPIFAINLIGVLLFTCIYTPVLRSFAQFRYFRFKLYLFLLPISCVVLYGGIKTAGLIGAISGVVLLRVLDIGISTTIIARKLDMTLDSLKPLASIWRTALATTIAMACTYSVKLLLPGQSAVVMLSLCGVVFTAVMLIAAFLTGAITEQEKVELRKFKARVFAPRHIDLSSESVP
jgi:O-antigen/teichoic acid export membrane protein